MISMSRLVVLTRCSEFWRHLSSKQQIYAPTGSKTKDVSDFQWKREQSKSNWLGHCTNNTRPCSNGGFTWTHSAVWNKPIVLTSLERGHSCMDMQIVSRRHQPIRCFASRTKRPGKGRKTDAVVDELESDDDDDDDMIKTDEDELERDWDPEIDEDESKEEEEDETSKDWKDIQQYVPSLRVDAVLSAGLGISRKKVEEAYLSTRLRVNGEKVTKKSRQVKEGDILDVILEHTKGDVDSDGQSAMRLRITEVGTDRTGKDRVPVLLRRWKHLKITKDKK